MVNQCLEFVRCDESRFPSQCENENQKAEGFQILHFDGSILSDIMTLKGTRDEAASWVLSIAMELKVKVIIILMMVRK